MKKMLSLCSVLSLITFHAANGISSDYDDFTKDILNLMDDLVMQTVKDLDVNGDNCLDFKESQFIIGGQLLTLQYTRKMYNNIAPSSECIPHEDMVTYLKNSFNFKRQIDELRDKLSNIEKLFSDGGETKALRNLFTDKPVTDMREILREQVEDFYEFVDIDHDNCLRKGEVIDNMFNKIAKTNSECISKEDYVTYALNLPKAKKAISLANNVETSLRSAQGSREMADLLSGGVGQAMDLMLDTTDDDNGDSILDASSDGSIRYITLSILGDNRNLKYEDVQSISAIGSNEEIIKLFKQYDTDNDNKLTHSQSEEFIRQYYTNLYSSTTLDNIEEKSQQAEKFAAYIRNMDQEAGADFIEPIDEHTQTLIYQLFAQKIFLSEIAKSMQKQKNNLFEPKQKIKDDLYRQQRGADDTYESTFSYDAPDDRYTAPKDDFINSLDSISSRLR